MTNLAELPTWLTVARGEIGIKERSGDADNPRVVEYLATVLGERMQHDSVAWCSAFANWCMRQSGYRGTGKANARSWLTYGAELIEPRIGCITVLSRPMKVGERIVSDDGVHGHVFFYLRHSRDAAFVHGMGGNQRNAVCDAPYLASRVIGWRWPTDADLLPSEPR